MLYIQHINGLKALNNDTTHIPLSTVLSCRVQSTLPARALTDVARSTRAVIHHPQILSPSLFPISPL
jgi:hypothetical protein